MRRQLLKLGLSPGVIDNRIKTGWLRHVYFVGHGPPSRYALDLAAVLACGPSAVLSHASAAALWKLVPYPARPRAIEVTVAVGHSDHKPGIRVHRTRDLDPSEIRTRHGIPVTSPTRTLLDLAATASPRELEQAVAEGLRNGLTTRRELNAVLARHRGRRGAGSLRRLVERDRDPALIRSRAEERFLALVRAAKLPAPEVNAKVAGFEVDFLWRDARLVVEIDGYRFHSQRTDFERDRRRDAELAARGFRVIRITWRQLVDEPAATLARVAQALAGR